LNGTINERHPLLQGNTKKDFLWKESGRKRSAVLWVETPYISETARRFEITYRLHFQDLKLSLPTASIGFMLGLLFVTDDGGDMFLRNFEVSPNYTAV
jgi:hypothetical protein